MGGKLSKERKGQEDNGSEKSTKIDFPGVMEIVERVEYVLKFEVTG